MQNKNSIILICHILILLIISFGFTQRVRDDVSELNRISVTEKLGDYIPLNVELTDQDGKTKQLNAIMNNPHTPVIFVFAYYNCPMLCTQVLNSISASIDKLDWESKNRFSVITVSIDPNDTPDSAKLKKERYVSGLKDKSLYNNWNFYIADQKTIDVLTQSLGFEYFYDENRNEYAHPAVLFILSPDGKISRYLYGLNFEPKDLKLSLLEATEGKIGNTVERLLLYCYHYDSTSNSYTLFAENIMRIGGILTLVILILFLGLYWFRENRRSIEFTK